MLTGRQIRQARTLLGLTPSVLAQKTKVVTTTTVKRAEADDQRPPIAEAHMKAIQQTLEALGVEFGPDGVRLRERESVMLTGGQMREACEALRWSPQDLEAHTALSLAVIDNALASPGAIGGTLAEEIVIKEAFHRAGVEFVPEGIRLREPRA